MNKITDALGAEVSDVFCKEENLNPEDVVRSYRKLKNAIANNKDNLNDQNRMELAIDLLNKG